MLSVTASGDPANGDSILPSISSDGRRVAFRSSATDLIAGDTNDTDDLFVKDLEDGLVRRVSERHDPIDVVTQADDFSVRPRMSGDGQYVVFQSHATNLVDDDTNGVADVFTRFSTVPRVTSVAPTSMARGVTANVRIGGNGFLSTPDPNVLFGWA